MNTDHSKRNPSLSASICVYLRLRRNSLQHAPLSLIPSGDGSDLRLLIHLTRADSDDPLEKIPVAGLLACMVLYAGGLDGLVLQRRMNLTIDAGRPVTVRSMALAGLLRGTFFHRGGALARLRAIAADPTYPESLRQGARAMVQE